MSSPYHTDSGARARTTKYLRKLNDDNIRWSTRTSIEEVMQKGFSCNVLQQLHLLRFVLSAFSLFNFSSTIIFIFIYNNKTNKKNSCIASGSKDNIVNVTNTCKGGKPPYIWPSSVKVRKVNFPAHFLQPVFFNIFKVEALHVDLQPATSLSHWNKLCHRHQEVPFRNICQILVAFPNLSPVPAKPSAQLTLNDRPNSNERNTISVCYCCQTVGDLLYCLWDF